MATWQSIVMACVAVGVAGQACPGQVAAASPEIIEASQPEDGAERFVNAPDGLPAWTAADVRALRREIALRAEQIRAEAGSELTALRRAELANYVAQAIERGIDVSDVAALDDAEAIPAALAASIVKHLRWHEHVKFAGSSMAPGARGSEYGFTPSVYGAEVAALAQRGGMDLEQALTIDTGAVRSLTLRGSDHCYAKSTFPVGMSLLSGATTIVSGAGGEVDLYQRWMVPIGWNNFHFYPCENDVPNGSVMVAACGLIVFNQSGGTSMDDMIRCGHPTYIPFHQWGDGPYVGYPDGFAAPYWGLHRPAPGAGSAGCNGFFHNVASRISRKTEGAAGQRVFTVEWYFLRSKFINQHNPCSFATFQVKLHEASGRIEYHYSPNYEDDPSGLSFDTVREYTRGIESQTGLEGSCADSCAVQNTPSFPENNWRYTPQQAVNEECNTFVMLGNQATSFYTGPWGSDNAMADGCEMSHSVWFRYVASAAGTVRITTCGSGFDTLIAAYRTANCPPPAGTLVGCNDDNGPACSGTRASVEFPTQAQKVYTIRVGGYNGASGVGTIQVSLTPDTEDGACCAGTDCTVTSSLGCFFVGGSYKGIGVACQGSAGNPVSCCRANFNQAGGVTVQDLFDFLTEWFAHDASADFNGAGGVTVQDLFDFLQAWFAGC